MKKQKFFWKLLLTVAVVAVLLTVVFAATGVFASLGDTTKVITVREGSVSCEVDRDYTIHNTSNVPVLLRAKLVVNWLDEDGNVLAQAPASASVSINTDPFWVQFPSGSETVEDGCWYYTGILQPNARVSLINDLSSDGGTVRVTVLAEVIQSEPQQAAAEAWGMTYKNGSWTEK